VVEVVQQQQVPQVVQAEAEADLQVVQEDHPTNSIQQVVLLGMEEQVQQVFQVLMAVAEEAVEQPLIAEVQPQAHLTGHLSLIQHSTLAHKQVVKVEQVDNFQRSLDMEQTDQTLRQALATSVVAVEGQV
jgi:hypothetical protein